MSRLKRGSRCREGPARAFSCLLGDKGFSAGVPPDEDTLRAKASEGVGNADGAKTLSGPPSRYQFFFPSFVLITHGMSGGNCSPFLLTMLVWSTYHGSGPVLRIFFK